MELPDPEFEALRRSEQRFRAAFQQQFQFMAILDPDGRVLEFNQQIDAEGGDPVPAEQVIGELFWRTVWWRDFADMQTEWPARLRQAALSATPIFKEDAFQSSSGELRHAAAAISAVRNESGDIDCFIVQAQDITVRKRAEAARLSMEAQLRETQKMEAIGTLAGGIAHDFNNILGAILGNVSLAREAVGPGHPALGPLGQIKKAGSRARSLVRQILTFSRHQPQELTPQSMRPVVEETVALMRATLPSVVQLEANLCEEPLWALANATQMQQVLMNLCTNAWHALKGGRGHIEIGLAPAPGGRLVLWVGDDGIGMDAATQSRVFEPFFTTKTVDEGTGLGLSVVHGIVVEHGGTIEVDSAPGRGTSFTVLLPAIEPGIDVRPAADSGLAPLDGAGQQVMVIDDDELMGLVAERLLKRSGYAVALFDDARRALDTLREKRGQFDLILTDYNMPGFSGIDVAREANTIQPGLPVVISSGYISEGLMAQAKGAGVRHVLHKENTVEELCKLVRRVLDGG
jgi:PAS domain S-box-containing protein